MKKKTYVLGLLIIIIIVLIITLYNKFICIYDEQEIKLTQNKSLTVYLKRIDYDLENGPKLVFRINGDDASYNVKITIKSIEWVYKLHSDYHRAVSISNNGEFEVDLYTYYKRDLKALELEDNKKNLQTKGYSLSDYKEAFLNVKKFEIEMEIYKTWTDDYYEDGIGFSMPREEKIAGFHKIIKINGHKENLIKQIYRDIDILQKYDVMQAPENAEWKKFEQIIPNQILEKINKVFLYKDIPGNKDNILNELKLKQYAMYSDGIPMYDNEKEIYRMLDNNGKEILKIVSCYINKQVGSSTLEHLETFYKVLYENNEAYYWIK